MSKVTGVDDYVYKSAEELEALSISILSVVGCDEETARFVALHLVDADIKGVESHGVMRLIQYVEQADEGYFQPSARPELKENGQGAWLVDGQRGFGMPAINLAVDTAVTQAKKQGISAVGVMNCGHTGRLGAFCEQGARESCLIILFGGGGRGIWRQVAPHGGTKAVLPTNPYAFGIPGGDKGPVILDFATSVAAGGWIYAAKSAGGEVPEGMIVDPDGNPSRDPDDYLQGGALLPAAGPKGYGLALIAELVGEAMLGPVTVDLHWILLAIDVGRYRASNEFHARAEAILAELRACPPAPGFDRVEIPGERERAIEKKRRSSGIPVPLKTWREIEFLATTLGIN